MDKQSYEEPTIIRSTSIALLQERFRKLERAREMRQQRDFFCFFADAEEQVVVVKPPEHSSFFHSQLIFSSKQPLIISPNKLLKHSAFYIQQTMEGRYADLQLRGIPNYFRNLQSTNVLMHNTTSQFTDHFDESDVDTSLHL